MVPDFNHSCRFLAKRQISQASKETATVLPNSKDVLLAEGSKKSSDAVAAG